MMGNTTQNITQLPKDSTLIFEESKTGDHGNVSSADFLSGLGISAMNKTQPIGRNSV